uniref:Integrin subunit alpha 6 n=1 Tax=Zonotrichia albicollis TaxID=44394 RepID=A0A8D2QK43_ZONAL
MWTCQTSSNMVKTPPDSVAFLFSNIPSTYSFKLLCFPCRLLVGAPREKAFPAQQANRTGGLYSCDIASPNTNCLRVKFDEETDPRTESKEDQWMGVTVQSQGPGGNVVTCAHRYEKRQYVNTVQETRDIIGRCYVLSQDLTIKDDMDNGVWSFCDGRLRGHEKFGSCQQGVAATFTRDYHYIVFGAPGTYNWKGVVRAEQKNQTFYDLGIFDDGPYEVGDESRQDKNLVPVPANSYLGFSLDSGKGIVSQDEMTFVSGAPRANHSGAVVLLKKEKNQRALSLEHMFEGEGLASSFGYDVAVVDLNSDGWQDIVVGAPQYFDRSGDIGGAVYIYMNRQGNWAGVKPLRLNGTTDSMFGLAVENVGDINQDGYPDIAVGAPYDGFGKVYIYHGSKNGINTKPAQILDGEKTNTNFFGYSIAGNMDLDKNSYPDVAVGSLSDSVNVEFLKEGCGEDNECHSNLKLQYRFCTREGNEDRFTYLPLENGMPVLVLKDQKDIALEITVTNNPSDVKNPQKDGEDAYEAKLIANFPDSLTYSAFREMRSYPEKQLTCGANQNGSQAECELGNPFKRNSNVSCTYFTVVVRSPNLTPITASAKVVLELLLSVTGVAKPSQVYFGGNIIGESAVKSEDDIGNLIEYEFRVTNLGRPLKTFGTASLDIQWPKEISNGKWLLYLMKIDSKGLEKVSCQPEGEINSLRVITDGQAFSLFSERKYKTLSCNMNARCVDIKCPLKGFDSKASIVLRSRLWNSTFLEEYSKMNYLDIVVRASISVPAAAKNVKLTNEVAQVVTLYTGVPWWIIAVAILAGILMLALLVFLLWKVSFY